MCFLFLRFGLCFDEENEDLHIYTQRQELTFREKLSIMFTGQAYVRCLIVNHRQSLLGLLADSPREMGGMKLDPSNL